MKKLTNLDKYVITPNVGFYGGFKFDGEDIFLCDDHDVDEGYDFKVKQEIKNKVLVTDIERMYVLESGRKVYEQSHMEVELEEEMLLVYVEGLGFTIPEHNMCKVEDAIDMFKLLEVANDTERAETESASTD